MDYSFSFANIAIEGDYCRLWRWLAGHHTDFVKGRTGNSSRCLELLRGQGVWKLLDDRQGRGAWANHWYALKTIGMNQTPTVSRGWCGVISGIFILLPPPRFNPVLSSGILSENGIAFPLILSIPGVLPPLCPFYTFCICFPPENCQVGHGICSPSVLPSCSLIALAMFLQEGCYFYFFPFLWTTCAYAPSLCSDTFWKGFLAHFTWILIFMDTVCTAVM